MTRYAAVYEFVQRVTGLTFPAARAATVEGVFASAMASERLASPAALVTAMESNAALRDDMIAQLTIGETYFFRDPGQFEVVRNLVLPDLLRTKAPGSPIRMWSAAAASGEEAYSLAILLEEQGLADRGDIVATDIARPRLAAAQLGRFKKWSMRGVSDLTIDRHFAKDGDIHVLHPRLRDRVEFKYLNLAEDTYPSLALGVYDMDLIMCRNVLIYFDEATICRVAQRLLDSLSRTGWLLTGASDPPISQLIECDVVTTAAGLAYRRPGAGGASAVSMKPMSAQSAATEYSYADIVVDAGPASHETQIAVARPMEIPVEIRAPGAGDAQTDEAALSAAVAKVRALCNTGDTRQAAELAVRMIDAGAQAAELQYLLGVALAHEDRLDDAIRAARRALYLDGEFIIAHVLLGQLYARSRDRDAAVRSFRNAADLLAQLDADNVVVATDGERVGRIRESVAVQLRLLRAAA